MRYEQKTAPTRTHEQAYEAPRIEIVLSPEELEREVVYGGVEASGPPS